MVAAHAAALLAEYDGFGIRRTGTPGEHACAHWTADQLRTAGVAVALSPVPLNRRAIDEAALTVAGRRIDWLPLFDAPDTPVAGITLALDQYPVLDLDPGAASIKGQPFEHMRRASSAPALLIATRDPGGALAPINAQYFTAPYGPPALQLAGRELQSLTDAAARGESARLVIRTRAVPGRSFNLIAGHGEAPRLVLLTPRTSWWESTAERAGGIIAWLQGLAHAQACGIGVRGFSTCGHELGHLGLEQILHDHRALVTEAPLWIHLGANLGCASDPRMTLRASTPGDAQRMRALLIARGYPADPIEIESIDRAMGEARDLALHGTKVLSLIGRNALFHSPADRFPGNVNAAWVAAICHALGDWIEAAR